MQADRQLQPIPFWAKSWLFAAGIYNLLWGAVIILAPQWLFEATGTPPPLYPQCWQCVGMIVGVYGIGYLIAAADPVTHWPIILVGLLGKVFGPIGFLIALREGVFPLAFGATILTNDLIWWVPFALILWKSSEWKSTEWASADALTYSKSVSLPDPPEAVFAFHEHPEALKRLIPPWEAMSVFETDNSLAPGSRVILGGSVMGMPVRWVAEHTEYDPPHLFADRQVSGPFVYWYHRHRIEPDGNGGSILTDEIQYDVPFGRMGRLFGNWLVRRKLEAMFTYRHEQTQQFLRDEKQMRNCSPSESAATASGKEG
ncbi:MAG: SRPBCC family protein [Planctomycetaceae bacterium]|nr:SRPBCC family protein [Planctomycetaceae bacterium]